MKQISALCLIALTGCVSVPVTSSEALPGKVLAYSKPAENTAPITVTRDQAVASWWCVDDLLVNGEVAAKIGNGERVVLHLPAGEYIISTTGHGMCTSLTDPEVEVVVVPGKPLYYRMNFTQAGRHIHRTMPR